MLKTFIYYLIFIKIYFKWPDISIFSISKDFANILSVEKNIFKDSKIKKIYGLSRLFLF